LSVNSISIFQKNITKQKQTLKFSIIIPTLNEAENIERLLKQLQNHATSSLREIIVVDGGSNDGTC